MNSLLCSKTEAFELIKEAEKEKHKILKELKGFVKGDIDIEIYPVQYTMGYGVAGKLLVNKEVCKQYDLIELLFYDLNNLMLKMLLKEIKTI